MISVFRSKMSALNLTVRVHPLVLFQVVDAYERRNADSQRVIGTLLGKLQIAYKINIVKWIKMPLLSLYKNCLQARLTRE